MTMPSSGMISIADINTEIRLGSTTQQSISIVTSPYKTAARTLAGIAYPNAISFSNLYGKRIAGQEVFVAGGDGATATGSFIVPDFVYYISAMAIGGGADGVSGNATVGGRGGGGGALAYNNDIPTTPGEALDMYYGAGDNGIKRGSTNLLLAKGASGQTGGQATSCVGDAKYSGGNGGAGGTNNVTVGGGGGAGGYSGAGGAGGGGGASGSASTGAGGGGGAGGYSGRAGGGGGGINLYIQGSSGSGGVYNAAGSHGGGGGSGGNQGVNSLVGDYTGGNGGTYGGGGGGGCVNNAGGIGRNGGMRIIWGIGRSYPSSSGNV